MRGRHRSYDDLIAMERERQRQSKLREADMRARQKKEGRTRETRRAAGRFRLVRNLFWWRMTAVIVCRADDLPLWERGRGWAASV